MRKISLFCLAALLLLISVSSNAQEFTLPKPAPGKALVIFMRTSSFPYKFGLMKFQFFDSTQYLGEIGHSEYLTYECNPGKRVLWSHGQQREYLEADLLPDQVYIINSFASESPLTKILSVHLNPYDPLDKKAEKLKEHYLKSLSKHTEIKYDPTIVKKLPMGTKVWLKDWTYDYHKKKEKNKKIATLPPEMHI